VLLFNYYRSPDTANVFQQWRIYQLLHISNVVSLAANMLAIVMLLEVKRFLDFSDSETLELLVRRGVLTFEDSLARRRLMRVATWPRYDERSQKLYIATFWGDIFSYDVQERAWGPTIRSRPGIRSFAVDSENSLIFAANYYGGYIDLIDLRSQRTLKYVIAQGLARHINLNPAEKSGILHTKGLGMYRFDYSDVAASPSGAILIPQLSRGSGP
jgi:hypothetical protein